MQDDAVSLPWYRLFWHHHQGLWNWELFSKLDRSIHLTPVRKTLFALLVALDTLVLCAIVISRRIRRFGITSVFHQPANRSKRPIIYFDMGTHREGSELRLMIDNILPQTGRPFRAFGFEASKLSFEIVSEKFKSDENVTILHKAICNEIPEGETIKLYHHGGYGDSVYRNDSTSSEEVQAIRFSSWLANSGLDLYNSTCILRMNIEGCEFDVVEDLIDSGLHKAINGYYGMWDDLSKIDLEKDEVFCDFLKRHRINPVTFNGRDITKTDFYPYPFYLKPLIISWRIQCIAYDIKTCCLQ